MSMNTTAKTWDDRIKIVKSLEPPSCLSVNYDSDTDEYKIWCGNQPYDFYEDELEKADTEKRKLEREIKRLNGVIDRLVEDE
ncbi:hypothetical protein [Bacillus thuringiensis]|uniref:hypothetical protein n=1 Tax=Bacillus thuringiensis TaxID=1428 RepID=UPI000BFD91C0|nr:hypothetical protein [Bacillus thuringiensis]PGT89807.1 hypothetical protein COD17_08645 [Bacillus thuringiensis]